MSDRVAEGLDGLSSSPYRSMPDPRGGGVTAERCQIPERIPSPAWKRVTGRELLTGAKLEPDPDAGEGAGHHSGEIIAVRRHGVAVADRMLGRCDPGSASAILHER